MTTRDTFQVRQLVTGEGAALRRLRRAALANAPLAFSSSPEDEAHLTDADFEARLAPPHPDAVFGVVVGEHLVGTASFIAEKKLKTRHKGSMRGVYVELQWRGMGAARALVRKVIDHAVAHGLVLNADVIVGNEAAIRLYRELGFVVYGVEPKALLWDGVFYDELMMVYRPNP